MATIIEQLQSILDKDTNAKLKAAVALHPELLVDDAFAARIVDIYNGAPEEIAAAAASTVTAPVTTPAAAHTPTVPGTASAAAVPVITGAATTTNNNSEILTALNGLKSSMETKFANVVTKDQIPELGRQMRTQAIKDAHLTMQIETLHRQTFGTDLNLDTVGKFIDDQKAAGVTYPDVKAAYLAMPDVSKKIEDDRVEKRVTEQVKQRESAATVPGQTTSVSLSPAQQVMAKAKTNGSGGDKTNLQKAIDALAARERSREAGGSEVVQ